MKKKRTNPIEIAATIFFLTAPWWIFLAAKLCVKMLGW